MLRSMDHSVASFVNVPLDGGTIIMLIGAGITNLSKQNKFTCGAVMEVRVA